MCVCVCVGCGLLRERGNIRNKYLQKDLSSKVHYTKYGVDLPLLGVRPIHVYFCETVFILSFAYPCPPLYEK